MYAFATVPLLAVAALLGLLLTPRLVANGGTAASAHLVQGQSAIAGGHLPLAAFEIAQSLALALPVVGMTLTIGLCARRLATAASRYLDGRPLLWPEPGFAPAAIIWNLLSLLALALTAGTIILLALAV